MGKIILSFVVAIVAITALQSCCEKRIYCDAKPLDFAFTGFDRDEVNSFTLRRYAKGDLWGTVLDSAQYIYFGAAPITTRPDTLPFSAYRTISKTNGITPGNDWVIYMKATGKLFFFTSVIDNENKWQLVRCGDNEMTCTKSISGFAINENWQNGPFVYIEKGKW